MTLTEKKQKFAAMVTESRGYLDAANMAEYAKLEPEMDKLEAAIKADEKILGFEDALKKIPEHFTNAIPKDGAKPEKITQTAEYKNAFFKAVREGRGALNSEEKAMFKNVMATTPDSAGGYLVVPAEMETMIRNLVADNVVMRQLATVISSTAERKIPFVSSYGAAAWIEENGDYGETDDAFGVVSIGSFKLGKIIKVSEELVNDIDFDLMAHISKSFARVYARAEEPAFLTGTGINQPTGVLVSATAGITTASATAIVADELIDLFYSLAVGYRNNATFLAADGTEKMIRKLKNGTTGDYIWQPGLTAGQSSTLLGRPFKTSDYMPAATAGLKAMAFGDFSEYTIKDTVGMQMQILDQLYAAKGQVGYRGHKRVDGALVTPAAVKLLTMKA